MGAAIKAIGLLALGECMVEFHAGRADGAGHAYGGDVANALVAFARLGGRAGFISQVGDDEYGAGLRGALQQEGVDLLHAPLRPGANGVYTISVDAHGERSFSYRRAGSPASRIGPANLDPAYLASARCLLVSGITQALSASARAATLAAARIGSDAGVMVVYDPNYRPHLWETQGGVCAARAAFDELLPYTSWILPSHPSDATLLGEGHARAGAGDSAAMAAQFALRGPSVVLKCGAEGCIIVQSAATDTVAGVKAPSVVDTTGAGDLWNGSFLFYLLAGHGPLAAAREANRLAARTLGYCGAIPPRAMYFPGCDLA
ncbi:MAG: sugar kinase [Pseudomonadota bacterium]